MKKLWGYEVWADGLIFRHATTQLDAWLACRSLSKQHRRVWMKKVRT